MTTERRETVLIVEDDAAIAEIERDYLEVAGFGVGIARDGAQGLTMGLSGAFDLVLLDVMLPVIDGMEVCRRLRAATDVPILMVTARTSDVDAVRGLGLGADDYVEKPFSPSVLVARVRAHLARYARLRGAEPEVVEAGPVRIDTGSRAVTVGGRPAELRAKEYDLLLFLARHPGVVFDRDTIYRRVWGAEAVGDASTVTVHVKRLRDKVEADPAVPRIIQTVRGAGYRLVGCAGGGSL